MASLPLHYGMMKKTLLLARDRIGIKPLYYFIMIKRLIFASEIKAILKALPEKPEVDSSSLFRYLILQYIPAPATLYKNIYKHARVYFDIK